MRGYRVNGRVVRPSRVVIGEYQEGAMPVTDRTEGAVVGAPPAPAEEPSIEDIVARAEAQPAVPTGARTPAAKEEDEESE